MGRAQPSAGLPRPSMAGVAPAYPLPSQEKRVTAALTLRPTQTGIVSLNPQDPTPSKTNGNHRKLWQICSSQWSPRVKWSRNWGFCSKDCESDGSENTLLQETQISVLPPNECKVFIESNNSTFHNPNREVCTGMKHMYPKVKVRFD